MSKLQAALIAGFATSIFVVGLFSPAVAEPNDIRVITTGLNTPAELLVRSYFEDLQEKSDGLLNADVASITTLGISGPESYRMAKLGVAQIVSDVLGYSSGDIPENDGLDVAGLADGVYQLRQAADAYLPTLQQLYEKRVGIKLLGVFPIVSQVIWCQVPITGLNDLRGKRVRAFGASMAEFLEALGATPVTMPYADVIPAMQRGVVECAVTGGASGNLSGWGEVATHLLPMELGWATQGVYANREWWQALQPNEREFLGGHIQRMIDEGWQRAAVETDHGIWCTVGDDRCDPSATLKPLNQLSLTLVPISDEDRAAALKLVEEQALPKFAARCGADCVKLWNRTVGEVYGVTAQ